jgi:hypothetical protein
MEEKAKEKNLARESVVIDDFPDYTRMWDRVIIGDYSMTAMIAKKRWLIQDVTLYAFGFPQTPTELTRLYIGIKYKLPLPIRKEQAIAVAQARPMPLLARPGKYGRGVYIDIKSAYWQIVKAIGWNVAYYPNRYIGKESDVSDMPKFLQENKPARAALVSTSRKSSLAIWNGEKILNEPTFNPMLNMRLVCLVSDVLQSVAREMKESIPCLPYSNTDGFIVPETHIRTAKSILQSWNLPYGIKYRGDIEIYGTGSYRVGGYSSLRIEANTAFDNIDDINWKWIKRNFVPFTLDNPPVD